MKTLLVTMEVTLRDLPMKDLRENAKLAECKVSELPRLADMTPFQVAGSLAWSFADNEELFGGSGMHIRVTDARVLKASWQGK